jgi:FkbH-like protein
MSQIYTPGSRKSSKTSSMMIRSSRLLLTEPEILEVERDPRVFSVQARLTDIFGDNGMISVVICRPKGYETWEIDTWLMSCRVLGRNVEHMVLREILEHARAAGVHKLIGTYRPTERNKLVVDHYAKLGFNKVREEEPGLTEWELLVTTRQIGRCCP